MRNKSESSSRNKLPSSEEANQMRHRCEGSTCTWRVRRKACWFTGGPKRTKTRRRRSYSGSSQPPLQFFTVLRGPLTDMMKTPIWKHSSTFPRRPSYTIGGIWVWNTRAGATYSRIRCGRSQAERARRVGTVREMWRKTTYLKVGSSSRAGRSPTTPKNCLSTVSDGSD